MAIVMTTSTVERIPDSHRRTAEHHDFGHTRSWKDNAKKYRSQVRCDRKTIGTTFDDRA